MRDERRLQRQRRLGWALLVLLVLAPGDNQQLKAAPGGAGFGFGGARLGAAFGVDDIQALNALKWGATGKFAGFVGLSPATAGCGPLLERKAYASDLEYSFIKQPNYRSVKTMRDVRESISLAYQGLAVLLAYIKGSMAIVQALIDNAAVGACVAASSPRRPFGLGLQSQLDNPNNPAPDADGVLSDIYKATPRPAATSGLTRRRQLLATTSAGEKFKKWLVEEGDTVAAGFRKLFWDVPENLSKNAKNRGFVGKGLCYFAIGLVFILRQLLTLLFQPIVHLALGIEALALLLGYPNIQSAAKRVRTGFDKPKKKLEKLLEKAANPERCDKAIAISGRAQNITDAISLVNKIVGATFTFGFLPFDYASCSLAQQLVQAARDEFQRSQRANGTSGGKRKLLATSTTCPNGTGSTAGAKTAAEFAETWLNISKSANETAAKLEELGKELADLMAPLQQSLADFEAYLNQTKKLLDPFVDFYIVLQGLGPDILGALKGISDLTAWAEDLPPIPIDTSWLEDKVFKLLKPPSLPCDTIDDCLKLQIKRAIPGLPDWALGIGDLPDLPEPPDFTWLEEILPDLQLLGVNITELLINLGNAWPNAPTTLLELTPATEGVSYMLSITIGDNVEVKCPDGWAPYVNRATLQAPSCSADYTAWLRFPCPANASNCFNDWTRFNWKCREATPDSPFNIPLRFFFLSYYCVAPCTLKNFRLLPEMLSASKNGKSDLPPVTYLTDFDLPTVETLSDFNGRVGSFDLNKEDGSGQRIDTTDYQKNKPGLKSRSSAINATEPRSAPPYASLSRGRLNTELLTNFFGRPGAKDVSVDCGGAAAFNLPLLLIEGVTVDGCNNGEAWLSFLGAFNDTLITDRTNNDYPFYASRRKLLRAEANHIWGDFCAWRRIAKVGYIDGPNKPLIDSMTPPMKTPWPDGEPSLKDFKDFVLPRGTCEFFTDGGTGRSHLAYRDWTVDVLRSAQACGDAVVGPTCDSEEPTSSKRTRILCDASTQRASFPLIGPFNDPLLKNGSMPHSAHNFDGPLQGGGSYYPSNDRTWCGLRSSLDSSVPDAAAVAQISSNRRTRTVYEYKNPTSTMTAKQQWVSDCGLEWTRDVEWRFKEALWAKFLAEQSQADNLPQACQDLIDQCKTAGDASACRLSEVFKCSPHVGTIQFVCIERQPLEGGRRTLLFKESLIRTKENITCGGNKSLVISSAELGQGLFIKSVLETVVTKMCAPDASSCLLDVNSPDLNAQRNDVLSVVWLCDCNPGYELQDRTCQPCQPGYYRGPSDASCRPTPAGSYAKGPAATEPTPCPNGTWIAAEGAFGCLVCPEGTVSAVVGANSSSVCQPCPRPNMYIPYQGATECLDCPPGMVSVPLKDKNGQRLYRNTSSGTLLAIGSDQCITCHSGTYRAAGMENCTLCEAGTYASFVGADRCEQAPVGSYVPSSGRPTFTLCSVGKYQDEPGKTSCRPCPIGQTTKTIGSNSSAECFTPVGLTPDQVALLTNLSQVPARPIKQPKTRRSLLQDDDDAFVRTSNVNVSRGSPCYNLLAAEALVYNKNLSQLLREPGNGLCSKSWSNSPACNYDGGDCCPSTCVIVCAQFNNASDTNDNTTLPTYMRIGASCAQSSFQCRDPEADPLGTPFLPCNGTRVTGVSLEESTTQPIVVSELQQTKVLAFSVKLDIAPPTVSVAIKGNGVCDVELNSAGNQWDGGDCCRESCAVVGACTGPFFCTDPRYANATAAELRLLPDLKPPSIAPPADAVVVCGARIPFNAANITAYDERDGVIRLAPPALRSSDTSVTPTLDAPLPCRSQDYRVTLTWRAEDQAGNSVQASQKITVQTAPCSPTRTCLSYAASGTCGANLDDGCGGQLANCTGTCAAGQRCVLPTPMPPPGASWVGACCKPLTCAAYAANGTCGANLADGCGGVLNCSASCATGQRCVLPKLGAVGACCKPLTCAAYAANRTCGANLTDGCGGVLNCTASCVGGQRCTPLTCAAYAANRTCGANLADGCGSVLNCLASCATGQRCVLPQPRGTGKRCKPLTCAAYAANRTCGANLTDSCSGVLNCSAACSGGQTCGAYLPGVPGPCGVWPVALTSSMLRWLSASAAPLQPVTLALKLGRRGTGLKVRFRSFGLPPNVERPDLQQLVFGPDGGGGRDLGPLSCDAADLTADRYGRLLATCRPRRPGKFFVVVEVQGAKPPAQVLTKVLTVNR